MEFLENMSDVADCYFVDLYVRMSNERESRYSPSLMLVFLF